MHLAENRANFELKLHCGVLYLEKVEKMAES